MLSFNSNWSGKSAEKSRMQVECIIISFVLSSCYLNVSVIVSLMSNF